MVAAMRLPRCLAPVVAVFCALLAGPVGAGEIRGRAVLAGQPPSAKKVAVTIDQYVCGTDKDAENLVISAAREISNVVVWLQNPPATTPSTAATAPVQMDQKSCSFAPRVLLVPAGGTVDFLNSDRLLHNLHSTPNANPPFNRTQPKGRTITISFSHPESIRVTCDLHSWMRGWVVVADHPFYALTDGGGAFELRGLPAGRYTLKVWQERLGTTSKDVVVGDQEPTAVTLEMAAR